MHANVAGETKRKEHESADSIQKTQQFCQFSSQRLLVSFNLGSSIAIPASADVVTDWDNATLDAIRAGNTAPPIASRSLAHSSRFNL